VVLLAVEKIHIEQFLELAKQHPVLDVRSPGEYKHAHIPGANSLPLFSDEERKIVGTAYKQQSREAAIKIGLDFFGPKMKKMVEEAESIVGSRESLATDSGLKTNDSRLILTYCWRGGMRSAGVAWLLDLYGFKVYTLAGGYKSFRRHVLDTFKLPFQFRLLGGYTGSGKTELLKVLKEKGEPVIDLEGIASHKGSAFGSIGMPDQPSQEMFENILSCELRVVSCEPNTGSLKAPHFPLATSHSSVWLEDESQRMERTETPVEKSRPIDQSLAQRDLVVKLLDKVSDEDRQLLMLKEVEGHSVEELAEITGMNENTIKVKLFRARQKLVKAAQRLMPKYTGVMTS